MLQQTQVERVLPKYRSFLKQFPAFADLASATVADVLRAWRGLGYNSRAVRLKRLAVAVMEQYGGSLPAQTRALRALPGIGPYTAAAVRVFAFQLQDAAVDTNLRRITARVLHGDAAVSRVQLEAEARRLVPRKRPHDWNSAMMDLGAAICVAGRPRCELCPLAPLCVTARNGFTPKTESKKSVVKFTESSRYARGRIVDRLRELPMGKSVSLLDLHAELDPLIRRPYDDFAQLLASLQRDGVVEVREGEVALNAEV